MKPNYKANTGILIRFDDIAPNMNWVMMDKCERLLNEYNIKPVLGVIPKNEDKDLLNYSKSIKVQKTALGKFIFELN